MKLIIKLFGMLMFLLGLSLLIKPEIVFGWMENNYMENEMGNTSLYIFAIVVRVALGILFVVTAKESKYPGLIKILGYLFFIAAIILIVIGHENFRHFVVSTIPEFKPYAPVSGIMGIAFGAFLMYAFSRNKELKQD
jgi:hypothetical protein